LINETETLRENKPSAPVYHHQHPVFSALSKGATRDV